MATETNGHVKPKRKSPDGISTNDLIHTSYQGTSDDIFPAIVRLYVAKGSKIADVTWGKGVFWKKIPKSEFRLLATDLKDGIDARALPYKDGELDCVVFDPPYMHTPGGSAHVNHQNYEGYYRNNVAQSPKKYHEAVLDLYFTAAVEARRVLREEGIYIVKCADEVCANEQRLTHVELINEYCQNGFIVEDLFILVRNGKPGVSRMLKQVHARKNHSYFIVLRKSKVRKRWKGVKASERPQSQKRIPGTL